ncbi:MAG: diacylglycerol kinase family protein [Salibacteraceae bacterium]|jgi:diacylglycerol kinase|nr:diacylglycerol kinase family protein [Salibacteraceae bacterium]MDP4686438.1 diacylglycerol kinase family protein [Salibacteraceae bacterium]MDP4764456.1 diacylglycerol kinase family protein [Salibacteraceae bacterium]MDP4844992.1 diacylglycerol kinase family protein [Salibacteraceae bacterium]MDP4935041.1 diacylglycerol kinase family protein [Salibacteraceae bacterium]
MKNDGAGLKSRIRSFGFALKGIKQLFQSEPNARIHLVAAIAAVFFGCFFGISSTEWCWIFLAITLVFVLEIVNTSIEKLVDLVEPNFNPLAGDVKDLVAGSVLIGAIFAALVGIVIFFPYAVAVLW